MSSAVEVIFEDDHLIALNKPSGVLTEGGADREEDLEQIASRLTGKKVFCCHRLDRLTSGVVLLRKSGLYKAELAAAFEKRKVRKSYWAIVEGLWDSKVNSVESQIAPLGRGKWENVESGGKKSVSTFRVLDYFPALNCTLIGVLLKTGRTHQARLHCLKAGYPIVGDRLYGFSTRFSLFGLHARELRIKNPDTGDGLNLVASVPDEWSDTFPNIQDR